MSFTNYSSVNQECTVYFKNGIIKFDEYGNLKIFKRNKKELELDTRIVRTGNVIYDEISINFSPIKYEEIIQKNYQKLENATDLFDFNKETLSTKMIISALISNEIKSLIKLPIDKNLELFSREWPIS